MSVIGNTITATDYNAIVGYDPTTNLNTFNAVWGTGSGKFGYGQTPLVNLDDPATTTGDDIIRYTTWATLVNAISTSGLHQGVSLTLVQAPIQGGSIQADTLDKTTTNITNLYTTHLNAAAQGTSANYPVVNSSIWRDSIEFTHIVTFANGEAARYFFNCGGQLALTFASPPGIQINALMSKLAENAGTLVISSPNVETIKIANKEYQGITKVGGTAPAALDPRFTTERYGVQSFNNILSTVGYYGMSSSYQEVFKQSVGGFPSSAPRYNYYDGSYISVNVKSNGPQGTHGDNGNVITIKTLWDQVPNGLQVTAGTTTTLTVRPPFLRNGMTQSWGTPVVSGSVSGS
jgi:hypothetical protein